MPVKTYEFDGSEYVDLNDYERLEKEHDELKQKFLLRSWETEEKTDKLRESLRRLAAEL